MNGVIIPPIGGNKTNQTTNKSSITWSQRGNVVTVMVNNYTKSDTNAEVITGLPAPVGGGFVSIPCYLGANKTGYVQHFNNTWTAGVHSSNAQTYGQGTYLTDE